MSIEGISLEKIRELPKADINSTIPSRQCHTVFHSFLSDDIKQDVSTTTAHSKRLIALLKDKKILTSSLSKLWGNTDGFALYIM